MSKTITYDEAYSHVFDALATRVNDSELIYPACDEDDNTIRFDPENDDPIYINGSNNATVSVTKDGELVFKDENGNDVTLMLLVPKLIK